MLYNHTKKRTIIERVKYAESFIAKLKGLMFEKEQCFDYALVFEFGKETRISASIHSLFVFFPFSAVYLDSNKRVVDIAIIKPFKLNYTPKKKAKYLVELPVKKTNQIKLGDKLGF